MSRYDEIKQHYITREEYIPSQLLDDVELKELVFDENLDFNLGIWYFPKYHLSQHNNMPHKHFEATHPINKIIDKIYSLKVKYNCSWSTVGIAIHKIAGSKEVIK